MLMLREKNPCRFIPEPNGLWHLVRQALSGLSATNLFYLGYWEPDDALKIDFEIHAPTSQVDNFFTLANETGYEQQHLLLSVGLRSSRFAPILFWEAFHTLAPEGLWIDVDYEERCNGTSLCDADYLDRAFFCGSLSDMSITRLDSWRARVMFKTGPSILAHGQTNDGWTFGILTAGPSAAARQMIQDILHFSPHNIEIVICGPMPENLPDDKRIRQIDLDSPEPRGWITRKKNLIADAARYENLCILHDRFRFPADFFTAMNRYGNLFSILTFPQIYFANSSHSIMQRYPDYQVLLMDHGLRDTFRTKLYNGDHIFHPRYDDFFETAFCCGGVYVTKQSIWQMIRQDESLFHCEWEDVLFGLQAQQMGIPHRVNPYACFESLAPHPLLMTRINLVDSSGRRERSFLHVSEWHKILTRDRAADFLPVIREPRMSYCNKVITCFNAMSMVTDTYRLHPEDFSEAVTLSRIWQIVSEHVSELELTTRDEVFQVIRLLAQLVYNFPACILQEWTWEEECRLNGDCNTDYTLIAAVRKTLQEHGASGLMSACVATIRCHLGKILARRPQSTSPRPFRDITAYFEELEHYYPVIFSDDNLSVDSMMEQRTAADFHTLYNEETYRKTVFVKHGQEMLPRILCRNSDGANGK